MSKCPTPDTPRPGKGWLPVSSRSGCRLPPAAAARRWLAGSVILSAGLASAQEALRNSLAGDAAIEAQHRQLESQPYTLKSGDFRLLVTPSLGLDYNDNVNTANSGQQQDFILKPLLQLAASYPVTAYNVLRASVGVGYDQYFKYNEYSGPRVLSGSDIAFDIYVKDFRIDLHDRFQYTQDSAGVAAVAGTGNYGYLQNTAGLTADWDLRDVVLTLGYDHQNWISSSSEFDYENHASELVLARAGFQIHPRILAGVEGTVSFTAYDQPVLNDNTGYSGGVYADWKPGPALRVRPRGGYTVYDFRQTSTSISAVDQNAWYADLTITHDLTKSLSYSLSAGHELRLGIQADTIEDWYARPNVNWRIIKDLTFTTYLSYEHGTQSSGGLVGSAAETYDWLGMGIGLSHSITKRLTLALNYRLTLRYSNYPSREYTQNLAGLLLTYQLQ